MIKLNKTSFLIYFGAMLTFCTACSNNSESAIYQEIKSYNKLVFASMACNGGQDSVAGLIGDMDCEVVHPDRINFVDWNKSATFAERT